MKKELAKCFFMGQNDFKKAIIDALTKVNTPEYSKQFEAMFNLKFQAFQKSQLVTG
ncbi:MAG: hypothetical protein KTR26_02030 [Flammeovirgaceae bacterium]|nr:hypothetical protein [Flammeovirgaceae bacterium]